MEWGTTTGTKGGSGKGWGGEVKPEVEEEEEEAAGEGEAAERDGTAAPVDTKGVPFAAAAAAVVADAAPAAAAAAAAVFLFAICPAMAFLSICLIAFFVSLTVPSLLALSMNSHTGYITHIKSSS